MDNLSDMLTLEGAGRRRNDTKSTFRAPLKQYEVLKKSISITIFEIELANLNHVIPMIPFFQCSGTQIIIL